MHEAVYDPDLMLHDRQKLDRVLAAFDPPSPPAEPTWPPDVMELIGWFQNAGGSLPAKPFDLCSGCRVVEPARFYASLRSEIATGPTGPRARLGTLQADLRRLRDLK